MTQLNPYALHLSGRDPIAIIRSTPETLTRLVSAFTAEALHEPPAPGKWSLREILCHLADTELAFSVRIRQTLAEPHHVIQPFDQDRWSEPYLKLDAAQALETFSAVRRWNVALFGGLEGPSYEKRVTHPERGEMTLQTLLETMAGHDLHHLRQIEHWEDTPGSSKLQ
jgi:uncharacterized damage-inducible protein DinB